MILAIVLQAFGLYSLLRVQRAPGIEDSTLRFAVMATMFALGIYIIAMGMRHVVLNIATHGISLSLGDAANEEIPLTMYSAHIGVLYGFIGIGAVTSLILGRGAGSSIQRHKHLPYRRLRPCPQGCG